MDISKGFFITGAVWLLIGMALGMYMGANENFTLAPVHAHINLLGFTLMTIFGIAYRVVPGLTDNIFATAHFWLHQVGTAVTLIALFMFYNSGSKLAAGILPPATGLIFLGIVAWLFNLLRNRDWQGSAAPARRPQSR